MDFALEFLARHLSQYTYLGLFLILSVGAFGFPIPEEIVLIAAGLFVHQGVSELVPTLLACASGQLIGDLLLFAVGRKYGTNAFHGVIRKLVAPERVDRVLKEIGKYGLLVVFFGRYLTGVRPAVFLGAGASAIPVAKFVLVDGLSALVSLFVWVFLGLAFSSWIEIALQAVLRAEEQILAALLAVVLAVVLEKTLVRFGALRSGSAPVRVTNWIRVPVLVVTATFAVLLAREHHHAKRMRLMDPPADGSLELVKDMSLLMEVLPDLASPEHPIEVVIAGSVPLLDAALVQAGYAQTALVPTRSGGIFERQPDVYFAGRSEGSIGLELWRSRFVYRSEPVWFGQFVGTPSSQQLRDLSRALTRSHYALLTRVGRKLRPKEKRRVLVWVLRDPVIHESR